MAKDIQISPDQNTVTYEGITHKFDNTGQDFCTKCSLFKPCCELQETVVSEFPFPCVKDERNDDKYGNFKLET